MTTIGLTQNFITKYKNGEYKSIYDLNGLYEKLKREKYLISKIGDVFYIDIAESMMVSEAEILYIEYIDRGVNNWEEFGQLLNTFYPKLKCLLFSQNYSYEKKEKFFNFVSTINLDILHISCSQTHSNIENVELLNKYQNDNSSVTILYHNDNDEIKPLYLHNHNKITRIYNTSTIIDSQK